MSELFCTFDNCSAKSEQATGASKATQPCPTAVPYAHLAGEQMEGQREMSYALKPSNPPAQYENPFGVLAAPESTIRAREHSVAGDSFTREEVQSLARQFTMQTSHFAGNLELAERLKAKSLRQHQWLKNRWEQVGNLTVAVQPELRRQAHSMIRSVRFALTNSLT